MTISTVHNGVERYQAVIKRSVGSNSADIWAIAVGWSSPDKCCVWGRFATRLNDAYVLVRNVVNGTTTYDLMDVRTGNIRVYESLDKVNEILG
jgi:hypothetical protein